MAIKRHLGLESSLMKKPLGETQEENCLIMREVVEQSRKSQWELTMGSCDYEQEETCTD